MSKIIIEKPQLIVKSCEKGEIFRLETRITYNNITDVVFVELMNDMGSIYVQKEWMHLFC